MENLWLRIGLGLILAFTLVISYHYVVHVGLGEVLIDTTKLKTFIQEKGIWGPIAIMVFMAMAIIMSPLPSAPIALVSGALYGHSWGTLYILIGAEIGALVAFTISKLAGYGLIKKYLGDRINIGIFKSQKNMMLIVFVSRLLPFVSFDIISYAAGLTPISYFRFAVATFFGILPISFLLAHFGSDLGTAEFRKIATTVFLLGFVTIVPVIVAKWLKRKRTVS